MLPNPTSVAVYHLSTVAGKQTYSAGTSVMGSFLPLDRKEQALEGGDYVVQYELYVPGGADVRVTDKLVIAGTTYYVKSIFEANFGGLPHKRLSISTEQ